MLLATTNGRQKGTLTRKKGMQETLDPDVGSQMTNWT